MRPPLYVTRRSHRNTCYLYCNLTLDLDLQNESVFLQRFDQAYRAVNDAVDMNNDDLVLMIRSVLQNNGVLSNNRRKLLIGKGHPTAIIDKAMAVLTECLADNDEAPPAPVPRA